MGERPLEELVVGEAVPDAFGERLELGPEGQGAYPSRPTT
jgi:hypothetical protein